MRRHWYGVGAVVAARALIYLLYEWSMIGVLQRLLLLNFIVLLLHQFEEYGWPGGFPPIMNMLLHQSICHYSMDHQLSHCARRCTASLCATDHQGELKTIGRSEPG